MLYEVITGDFVLAGGEIAAMALIEACVRLLPGVLGSASSRITSYNVCYTKLLRAFIAMQIAGGIFGVTLAHAMFDLDVLQQSIKARAGAGQILGEAVATFGLVLTILGALRFRPESVAAAVGLFV